MEYTMDKIEDERLAQLRKDIKKNQNCLCYDPCIRCEYDEYDRCAVCNFNICGRVLKELYSGDFCKFCVGGLKRDDGIIECGYHCDEEDSYNYFSCFEPNYLAVLDLITGQQGGLNLNE